MTLHCSTQWFTTVKWTRHALARETPAGRQRSVWVRLGHWELYARVEWRRGAERRAYGL